jgi:hypothetical protein
MNDWATVADLATAGGTLVLAVATFASVRSGNRSARTAEVARKAGMRPILMNSRLQDQVQKVAFADQKWLAISGGGGAAEATEDAVYLAISLRNAGTGMGILHSWRVTPVIEHGQVRRPSLEEFTAQTRDMYVAAGDCGFWQGALRDPSSEHFKEVAAAVEARDPLMVDLLYGDFEGGQRVISRFTLAYSPFGHREHGQSATGPAAGPGRAGPVSDRPGSAGDGAPGVAGDASGAGDLTRSPGEPEPGQPDPGPIQRELRARPPASRWIASVSRHWNVDQPDPIAHEVREPG